MKIKTVQRIIIVLAISSLICLSIIIYTAVNNMIAIMNIVSIIGMSICIVGMIVICVVKRKDSE